MNDTENVFEQKVRQNIMSTVHCIFACQFSQCVVVPISIATSISFKDNEGVGKCGIDQS